MAEDPGAPDTTAGLPERLLVPLLALGALAALVLLRSLDDNRLVSWRWVFAEGAPARLHALAVAGMGLAVLLSRARLPRRPAAILFLSSLAVGACFWGEPEAIVDASRYFSEAKYLEVHGLGRFLADWGRELPAWTDLPLVPLLHGLAFRLLGESRAAAQALNTLLFAGSVALTCRLGSALWSDEVGFAAGAFLLGSPYLLVQVPLMLVDVPTMFFLALALLAAVGALRRGGAARILAASLAVLLALLSKYSAWLLLSALPVAWAVLWRGAPRPLRTGLAIALASGLLGLAALLWHREVCARQIALLLSYQAPGLRRWGESFASTFLFQVHPFLAAAALVSAWLAARRRDARILIPLWPVLLLLALRVERIRYWIPVFPMLALLAASGLRAIRAPETRRLVLWCAVASSLAVAGWGYLPFLRRTSAMNLAAAGAYLDSLEGEAVEVFAPAGEDPEVNPAVSVPLLDLHTRKRLVYRDPGAGAPPGRETSPLRFTWEWRSPPWYLPAAGDAAPAWVVVIADDLGRPLPEPAASRLRGLEPARVFAADEGVFRYRTLVAVYRAAPAAP